MWLYLFRQSGLRHVETRFQGIGGELLAQTGAVEHGAARVVDEGYPVNPAGFIAA